VLGVGHHKANAGEKLSPTQKKGPGLPQKPRPYLEGS
jgi:hypothetical protein